MPRLRDFKRLGHQKIIVLDKSYRFKQFFQMSRNFKMFTIFSFCLYNSCHNIGRLRTTSPLNEKFKNDLVKAVLCVKRRQLYSLLRKLVNRFGLHISLSSQAKIQSYSRKLV